MALLCVMTSANRFVQLSVIPEYIQSDNPEILQLIHPYGSRSIMFALENLGWGLFYGLGALCAAFAFGSSGLELWISWLFLIGGLLSLLYMLGVVIHHPIMSLLGFPAWSVLLTVTSVLIAVWFWQML
jgi:hypothetical protein